MELVGHEAIVLTRYKDSVGVWTIGVGHTKAAGGIDPATFMGELSLDEAMILFEKDVARYVADVNSVLKRPVSQTQFDALVSFHYNTGAIKRASLVTRINAGDMTGAANGFMAWIKPPEIIGRRTKEHDLFAFGKYSHGGFANIYPATPEGRVVWNKPRRVDLRKLGKVPAPPDVEPVKPPAQKPSGGRTAAGAGGVIVATGAGAVIAKQSADKGASTGAIAAVVGISLVIAIAVFFIIRHWRTKS